MENPTDPKDLKKIESELQKTSPQTESQDQWHKTPTSQEEAKATSQLEGLKHRIEECPSKRVREALVDSLNKENTTS